MMQTMMTFFRSRSGYVQQREGLAMGWIVVALLGVTVLLGTVQQASATYCWGVPEGSTEWKCSTNLCYNQDLEEWGKFYYLVRHLPTPPHCTVLDYTCSTTCP